MITMNMPGFTAEASLNKMSRYCHTAGSGTTLATRVVPQARSCILTADGGQYCCIPGPKGPICWTIPPSGPIVAFQPGRVATLFV